MNKPSILVVEDDVPVRCLITTTLKTHGYKYLTASNGETAIMMTTSHNPYIMLLDLGLPDIDGIEVIVSAVVQCLDLIRIFAPGTQDNDGQVRPCADAAQKIGTIPGCAASDPDPCWCRIPDAARRKR